MQRRRTFLFAWIVQHDPPEHPGRFIARLATSQNFCGVIVLTPLEQILTENYLRWHSDPGSANRQLARRTRMIGSMPEVFPPCFDSNRE
jgi:hypothetical protein